MSKIVFLVVLFTLSYNFIYSQKKLIRNYESSKTVENSFFIKILNKAYVEKIDAVYFLNMILFKESSIKTKKLISHKIIKKNEVKVLKEPLSKGLLAQFIVRLLNLKNKDLAYFLFRSNRYAYRICNDDRIFQFIRGNASEYLSGMELAGIIKRLEKLVKSNSKKSIKK